MALMLLAGLRLRPGSGRLILLRLGLLIAAALPTSLLAARGLAAGAARKPYFTDIAGPLPVVPLVDLFRELPDGLLGAALVGMLGAILGNQILTASALTILSPRRSPGGSIRVWRSLRENAARYLGAFLRILVLAAAGAGIGVYGVGQIFERVALAGERAGWSASTQLLWLPVLQGLCLALWLATVGAASFWWRLLTVAEDNRRIRRSAFGVLRVWRGRWGAGPLFYVALTLGVQLASGGFLVAWRQSAPITIGGTTLWLVAWLAILTLHAGAWHWLLRAGLLLHDARREAR